MCGIFGVLALGERPPDDNWLQAMATSLAHRGPDGQGFYRSDKIGLGHRRLAMLGGREGHQPMGDATGQLHLSANGEIYNHQDLRQQLRARGHMLGNASDMEVVAPLYRDNGPSFAEQLVGMFALALWDEAKGTLVLARDRYGIKPLYYYRDDQFLLFASELSALLCYPGLKRQLNLRALDQYCRFKAVLDPETFLRGVRKLPAGTVMVVGPEGMTLRPFSSRPREHPLSVAEALRDSVAQCLQSEAPLGVFLSGGIDSSVVAALTLELTGSVTTFSVGFRERLWDESDYSQQVAHHLGSHHHPLVMSCNDALTAALALGQGLDEPMADTSALACYFLAQQARQEVKGVLTGDGGDEVFAGYPWHQPGPPFDGQLGQVIDTITGWKLFDDQQRAALYRPELLVPADSFSQLSLDLGAMHGISGLQASLQIDRATCLRSDLLVKTDRTSMLNSLEGRLPMLNHPLVEAVDAHMQDGLQDKVLLRQAYGYLLPDAVVKRPKKGFGVPIGVWMWQPGPFRDLVNDVLQDPRARLWDYFQFSYGQQLLRQHDRLPQHGHELWALLLLEQWLRRVFPG